MAVDLKVRRDPDEQWDAESRVQAAEAELARLREELRRLKG